MQLRRFVVYAAAGLIVSTLAMPVRSGATSSKVDTTLLTMGEAQKRIEIYMLKSRAAPINWSEVYGAEAPPKDSWGAPIILVVPGPAGQKYDLVSYGSDGRPGTTTGCLGRSGEDYRWSEHY